MYDSWREAKRQVKNFKTNLYSKFDLKRKAKEFVDGHSKVSSVSATAKSQTASQNAAADSGTASATPMSQNSFGDDESYSQGNLEIETPSFEELEQAEAKGQVRVFACHTDVGYARIALTFEKTIVNVNNPEVQVVNSESTLLDKLAVAEVRLRSDNSSKRKTLSDRLAEARARASARSRVHSSAAVTALRSSTSLGEYESGMLLNRSAVGRAKETQMIQYYFVDFPKEISVVHGLGTPFPHELDDDMDLPNTKAISNTTRDIDVEEFFKAKEKAIVAWPLLDFQEFIRVCRKARRLCQTNKRTIPVVKCGGTR